MLCPNSPAVLSFPASLSGAFRSPPPAQTPDSRWDPVPPAPTAPAAASAAHCAGSAGGNRQRGTGRGQPAGPGGSCTWTAGKRLWDEGAAWAKTSEKHTPRGCERALRGLRAERGGGRPRGAHGQLRTEQARLQSLCWSATDYVKLLSSRLFCLWLKPTKIGRKTITVLSNADRYNSFESLGGVFCLPRAL